jgi:HTH-type transcriptional regulator, transcriptional repressor of NAD biosynthesis genes
VRLGVTIGKFFPFHLGHDLLVREAKARCDRLVVIVGERPGQALPGPVRAAWIRELHPDVEVVLAREDDLPEAPEPWARRTLDLVGELLGRRPDVAFTSEAYGPAWAAAMGAAHEAIDTARGRVPCSGTALRADLGAGWAHLTPPAKAWLCRRVVVLGVESSGTTTLARELAERLRTAWVPEHGRSYWEGRRFAEGGDAWATWDFAAIARAQRQHEDDLARRANRVLVCDTDPLATCAWARRYTGACDAALERFALERRPELTLLTAPDFPFVQDGTRDGEHVRLEMHGWFVELLERSGRPWRLLEGPPARRLDEALRAVEPLLRFPPLAGP